MLKFSIHYEYIVILSMVAKNKKDLKYIKWTLVKLKEEIKSFTIIAGDSKISIQQIYKI